MELMRVYIDLMVIEMPVQIYEGTDEYVVRALISEYNIQQIGLGTSGVCGVWAERAGTLLDSDLQEVDTSNA